MTFSADDLHGWLILNKPVGISSAQAVAQVKKLLKPKKIGHGGTLDPLASGVLPLALGEATKTFNYMVTGRKSYRFTVKWGEERTTDDAEGEVTATSNIRPSPEQITAILPLFTGEIMQSPPAYSAVKIKGKRAYARARSGEEVKIPPRKVQIHALNLKNIQGSDPAERAEFEVSCGKGTYIRSLARDIAHKLGTVGHVTALERLSVGNFGINEAILLDNLQEVVYNHAPDSWLLPLESALDDIPAITLDSTQTADIRHGRTVRIPPRHDIAAQTVICMQRGKPVAMGEVAGGLLRPLRVFNC